MSENVNFQISPPKRRGRGGDGNGPNRGESDSARPQYLILGTFTSTPKLHFERLQVGQSRNRVLVVRNPSPHDTMFHFTKMPSKAFQLFYAENDSNMIPAGGQLTITVKWTPLEVGRVFEALKCQSQLSGVTLTVQLLGEAEPGPKVSKNPRRNFSAPSGRQLGVLSSNGSNLSNSVNFGSTSSLEKRDLDQFFQLETSSRRESSCSVVSSVLSPSRRETYLVPPTPAIKAPPARLTDLASTFSALELNFDDDDFKENANPSTVFSDHEHGFPDFAEYSTVYSEPEYDDLQTTNSITLVENVSYSTTLIENDRSYSTTLVDTVPNGATATVHPNQFLYSDVFEEDLEGELLQKAFSQLDTILKSLAVKN